MNEKERKKLDFQFNDEMDRFIDKINWRNDKFNFTELMSNIRNVKMRNESSIPTKNEQFNKKEFIPINSYIRTNGQKEDFSKDIRDNSENHFKIENLFNFKSSNQFLTLLKPYSIYELYKICESREVKLKR